MKYLLVFFAMTALDFCWARYTVATSRLNALRSGIWASLLILLSGFVTTSYVADHTMLLPACAGAFIGTYIALKMKGTK